MIPKKYNPNRTQIGNNINTMTNSNTFHVTDELYMEGRKEMFYLTTHSTHFILQLYGVRHMLKYHTDSEMKPAATTWATLSD